MEYKKTTWVNNETPLDQDNLNKIEEGIFNNSEELTKQQEEINTLKTDTIPTLRDEIDETIDALTETIDKKVTAIDTNNPLYKNKTLLYGTTTFGEPTCYEISMGSARKETIVRRDADGDIIVPQTPNKANAAASKDYVQVKIASLKSITAPLVNGKVPLNYLPEGLNDVIEGTYINRNLFLSTLGTEVKKDTYTIYVDTSTNKIYRWSGSHFVEISASLALGENESTAFPGDRGKKLEDDTKELDTRITELESTYQECNPINFNIKSPNNIFDILSDPLKSEANNIINVLNAKPIIKFKYPVYLKWTQDMYYRGKKHKGDEKKTKDIFVPNTFNELTLFNFLQFIGFHEDNTYKNILMYGAHISENPSYWEFPIEFKHPELDLHSFTKDSNSNIFSHNHFFPEGAQGETSNTSLSEKLSLSLNWELADNYYEFMKRFIGSRDFRYSSFAFNTPNEEKNKQKEYRLRRAFWKKFMLCRDISPRMDSYDLEELELYSCVSSKWMTIYIRPYININTEENPEFQICDYGIKLSYIFIPTNGDYTQFNCTYVTEETYKDTYHVRLLIQWDIVKLK